NVQAGNGDYVCASPGEGVVANRGAAAQWETFQLKDLDEQTLKSGNRVALLSWNDFYVCAEGGGGGPVVANRSAIGAWERFVLESGPTGTQILDGAKV